MPDGNHPVASQAYRMYGQLGAFMCYRIAKILEIGKLEVRLEELIESILVSFMELYMNNYSQYLVRIWL